jgi:hypothetical protein
VYRWPRCVAEMCGRDICSQVIGEGTAEAGSDRAVGGGRRLQITRAPKECGSVVVW